MILIEEDNDMSRMPLHQLLYTVGITAYQATNGLKEVEKFIQKQPDLLLMDMRMSVMKGLEATRQIKQLDSGKNRPVEAMTGQA